MVDEIGEDGEGGRVGVDVGEGGDDDEELLLIGERWSKEQWSSRAIAEDLVASSGGGPHLDGDEGPPSQPVRGSRLRSRSPDL